MDEKVEISAVDLRGIIHGIDQQKRELDLLRKQVAALLPFKRMATGPARITVPARKQKGVKYGN